MTPAILEKKLKIFLASDHAGFEAKSHLIKFLKDKFSEFELIDVGPFSSERCDYPFYAKDVCSKVLKTSESLGILICGTGIGMSMVANKYLGIRAALVKTAEEGKLCREHNNANILCLGSRVTSPKVIEEIVSEFFSHDFLGGRHQERLDLFSELGEKLI